MHNKVQIALLLCLLAAFYSCSKSVESELTLNEITTPYWFPEIDYPEDNTFTNERWELGKKLFYSKALSRDETISCAHCHNQNLAFSDGKKVSDGVDGLLGNRNAPTLSNVAYHPYFTREGGVPTLEMQIAVPVQEHNEFDFNMVELAERLKLDSELNDLAFIAYDREMDPFVITRAIATFERSLISGNSPFDQYYYKGDISKMSTSALRGKDLFFGEAKCSQCHSGFDFTTYDFENNGLYLEYEDSGRFRLTELEGDIARFKIPTLRNVEFTGPYMHDGSINTLYEVVNHYSEGINDHFNKNSELQNLYLSENQKYDLVNFLKSLSDKEFINDPKFKKNE